MTAVTAFIPPFSVGLLFSFFVICRFENQRWTRARARGLRGSSEGLGVLVDLTGLIGLVFGLAFLVAAGFDHGWQTAVGLFVVGAAAAVAYSFVSGALVGGDSLVLWILGTLGIWVFGVLLMFRTTWFGLVS